MKEGWNGVVFIAPMVKIVESMKPHPFAEMALRKMENFFPEWPVVPSPSLDDRCFKLLEKRDECKANPLQVNFTYPRVRTALHVYELSLVRTKEILHLYIHFFFQVNFDLNF